MKRATVVGGVALGIGLIAGGAARSESYFTAYTGDSLTKDSNLRIVQPTLGTDATYRGVGWDGKEFESPPYYGFKWGHYSRTNPNWGVEFDFTHYKVYAETGRTLPLTGTWNGVPVNGSEPLGNRVQKFSISHGVNTLGFHLLYRLRSRPSPSFPNGRIQPYVGAGPAYYYLHPESTINGRSNKESFEWDNWGWQAMGGLRYGLSKRTSLYVEGKYSSGKVEVNVADGGFAETRLKTWHTTAGVQYGF